MRVNRKALAISFVVTLAFWAIAWGITVDGIWQAVFDAGTSSLKVTFVP